MAGLAYHKIITKGLHGGPACEGLITAHFSLYCEVIPPPPPPIISGGGGPYPGPAWNKVSDIQNFFKRVEQPYYLPHQTDQDLIRHKRVVVLKINFGNINVERNYIVPIKRANVLIKVLKVVNTVIHTNHVKITNLKLKTKNALVKVKNLRNRLTKALVTIKNLRHK